jgi:hypothetical protein
VRCCARGGVIGDEVVRRNVRALCAVLMVSVLPTRPSVDQLVQISHTLGGALPPVDLRAVCLVPVRAMMMLAGKFRLPVPTRKV